MAADRSGALLTESDILMARKYECALPDSSSTMTQQEPTRSPPMPSASCTIRRQPSTALRLASIGPIGVSSGRQRGESTNDPTQSLHSSVLQRWDNATVPSARARRILSPHRRCARRPALILEPTLGRSFTLSEGGDMHERGCHARSEPPQGRWRYGFDRSETAMNRKTRRGHD